MASTIQLQRTVNVSSGFIWLAPLTGTGAGTNEPAFSIGDWVRQFILGPPFAWRWNRAFATLNIMAGTQDYLIVLADFGWLESASCVSVTTNVTTPLEVWLNLAPDTTQNTPTSIAAVYDNDANPPTITFRFLPVPDQNYSVSLIYQKAALLFTNLTDTWAPIPDYFSYLYNQGFLAKAYEYWNDARFGVTMQLFIRQVLGANAGLSDSQVNIFLGDRVAIERTAQSGIGNSQAGRASRGMLQ